MQIKWYGHSCFLLRARCGTKILTDPYDHGIGYPEREFSADIVTVSHAHHDHNAIEYVKGEYSVCDKPMEYDFGEVKISGYKSYHDESQGAIRGENIIFVIETEGIRIAHMGDLGDIPDEAVIGKIKPVDIILVPCGGEYTIGPKRACEVANAIGASVLIPMHYQTDTLLLPKRLKTIAELLAAAKDCKIHKLNECECTITKSNLSEDRVIVLDYERKK